MSEWTVRNWITGRKLRGADTLEAVVRRGYVNFGMNTGRANEVLVFPPERVRGAELRRVLQKYGIATP